MIKIILASLTFFIFCVFNLHAVKEINSFGIILKHPVNVRIGPDTFYRVAFIMGQEDVNVPFSIRYQTGDWYFIETFNKKSGWVKINLVKENRSYCMARRDTEVLFRPNDLPDHKITLGKIKSGKTFMCKNYPNSRFVRTKIKGAKNGWVPRKDVFGIK